LGESEIVDWRCWRWCRRWDRAGAGSSVLLGLRPALQEIYQPCWNPAVAKITWLPVIVIRIS